MNVRRRVEALEARKPARSSVWRRVVVGIGDDMDAALAEASQRWPGGNVIARQIIAPG